MDLAELTGSETHLQKKAKIDTDIDQFGTRSLKIIYLAKFYTRPTKYVEILC